MKEQIEFITSKCINDINHVIDLYMKKDKLNMFERSLLGECGLTLKEVISMNILVPHETVICHRDYSRIFNLVYSEESLYYYSSFHYASKAIKSGDDYKISNQFKKINLDILAIILKIKAIEFKQADLDSSTDNYFFTRMECCTWAYKLVLNKSLDDYYIPSIYSICNLAQALIMYKSTGKSKYAGQIDTLLNMLSEWLNAFLSREDVNKVVKHNVKLKLFINNQISNSKGLIKWNLYEVTLDDLGELGTLDFLRALTSVYEFKKSLFISLFEEYIDSFEIEIESMNMMSKSLLLRVICLYLTIDETLIHELSIETGIVERFELLDTNAILNYVFSLDDIKVEEVKENHLDKLLSLKDDELRVRFSKTMDGVSKAIVQREARKPHGAHEISDMEVPVRYGRTQVYMCLPFKSGVEISTKSVPVDISYQIVRPFIEFDNCMVVFVTAKRCSEYLMNYIKKLRDKMGWSIEVIEYDVLAALLLMNGEL